MDNDIEKAISQKVSIDRTEKNIGDSSLQGLLIQATRDQTRETKKLSSESNSLQRKIYRLTSAVIVLTLVLVIIGIIQLVKH